MATTKPESKRKQNAQESSSMAELLFERLKGSPSNKSYAAINDVREMVEAQLAGKEVNVGKYSPLSGAVYGKLTTWPHLQVLHKEMFGKLEELVEKGREPSLQFIKKYEQPLTWGKNTYQAWDDIYHEP